MDWSKRFIRQWIFANKNIRFKTPILRSDLCDYSDTCIALKVTAMVGGSNDANKRNENLTFNNIATFRSCISKINNTFTDNAEDLDIAMSNYNLLEYSDNLWHQEVCGIIIEMKLMMMLVTEIKLTKS